MLYIIVSGAQETFEALSHFLFGGTMKEYKTNIELINYLISKGLIINDKENSLNNLERYSYYSIINGYKFVFKNNDNNYKENTSFEEIFALYEFDKNIKSIFLKYILEIEIIIKSLMSNTLAKQYGIQNYLNSSNFDDKYILNNSLNFTITQDDNADLSSPILYNNCANPIVISYKNENLITDHTISNKDSISYDGSLLKDCNIILSNLKCSFSFYIVIENNLGHKYRCPIYLTIPLSNGTSSIYNGSFYYTYNPDYYFYLYT